MSDAWGAPVNLGARRSTRRPTDFVPSFSSDGHWMFFASTRPGGFGGADLYQSYRADIHDDFGWQTPTNLGPNVNTAAAENGNGYFDNGGHPQLLLRQRSARPRREQPISYLSNRQADGTWGPATLVPELTRHRKSADSAPGRAGDLLLLEPRRRDRRRPISGPRRGPRSTRHGRRRSISARP